MVWEGLAVDVRTAFLAFQSEPVGMIAAVVVAAVVAVAVEACKAFVEETEAEI